MFHRKQVGLQPKKNVKSKISGKIEPNERTIQKGEKIKKLYVDLKLLFD
jgi:hypothetical protein